MKLRFAAITVFFDSVETKWVPEAYLYRLGRNIRILRRFGKVSSTDCFKERNKQSLIFFMFES